MDLAFINQENKLNIRCAALIMHKNKLLVINDNHAQYDYLIGGRIHWFETSQQAIEREIEEELDEQVIVERLVFTYESFFFEPTLKQNYHELGYVYLVSLNEDSQYLKQKETVRGNDCFKWVSLDEPAMPQFILEYIKEMGIPSQVVHLESNELM